jgi:NADH dehydrogenase FAD-containing subunit
LTVESAVPPPDGKTANTEEGMVVKKKDGKEFYEIPYDKLVIAVGCYSASLGIKGVSSIQLKLKLY